MIKTSYTTKLFFGKYHTRVIVVTKTLNKTRRYGQPKPTEIKDLHHWCSQHFQNNHYVIKDHFCQIHDESCYQQMVYLSDPVDREKLLANYGSRISELTQPLDEQHQDQLEVRNLVVVRNSLLYNRYRHSVYFKYDRTQETYRWLKTFFKDEPGCKLMPDPKHDLPYGIWPRVYLEDESHLTTLKLMWQDSIDYVKTVHLICADSAL